MQSSSTVNVRARQWLAGGMTQGFAVSLAATVSFLFSVGAPQTVGSVHQQLRSKSKASTESIRVNVEMVLVNVGVADSEDRPVMNLQKDNFQLFEEKVEQEIISFSQEDAPASIGIILDTSGSMRDKIDRSRKAVLQILKDANSQDEFFLVSFGSEAKLEIRLTSNVDELQYRMMSLNPRGATALLDAIHMAMKEMKNAHYSKHALIVISDGGDNHSWPWHNESRTKKDLEEANCQLYAMGIYDKHDMEVTYEERDGPMLLAKLADITGGHAFAAWSLDQLPGIAAKIDLELRNQYVLGYRPKGPRHDGSWRGIKVKVGPPVNLPPLHVYARSGYYSPKD